MGYVVLTRIGSPLRIPPGFPLLPWNEVWNEMKWWSLKNSIKKVYNVRSCKYHILNWIQLIIIMPFAYDVNKFILWNAEFIVIQSVLNNAHVMAPSSHVVFLNNFLNNWDALNERSGWFPLLHYFIQIKIWLPNFWAWPWPRSCSKTLADGRINVFCHKPRHPLSDTIKLYYA